MPQFRFAKEVLIDRPLQQVRDFFADLQHPVRWDRSVSKVVYASSAPLTVGAKFTTIGPSRGGREGKRSDYQVIAIDGDEAKLALLNSPIFKSAIWTMRLVETGSGTKVACEMDLSTDLLRAPIGLLLKLNAKAIATDLQFLKRAIENGEVAKR
jgi:Polyketide cyclase / dehydrase and lipid transport